MSNSSLVCYTKLSPNHSGKRTHSIDRITPHCVVGQLSCESICACFPEGRGASCNYGIGSDGRISLCVDERNRSWCSYRYACKYLCKGSPVIHKPHRSLHKVQFYQKHIQ